MQQNTQAIGPVQQHAAKITASEGFDAFKKLFELSGNDPEVAKALAEKEAYHLGQLMADNPDLAAVPPAALAMEMRKIPLQGVSLDPALKLAYIQIDDKAQGKVSLQITGRGKAVQGIAQNLIRDVDTQVIFSGDEVVRENGMLCVIPKFKENAPVIGGIITITWKDGRITQDAYNQSHIRSWMGRSAARFRNANKNYTSFNGSIEPGFMQTKMLKHKLDRIGINPFPNAYRVVNRDQIKALPGEVEDIDDISRQEFQPEPPEPDFTPDIDNDKNWVL